MPTKSSQNGRCSWYWVHDANHFLQGMNIKATPVQLWRISTHESVREMYAGKAQGGAKGETGVMNLFGTYAHSQICRDLLFFTYTHLRRS